MSPSTLGHQSRRGHRSSAGPGWPLCGGQRETGHMSSWHTAAQPGQDGPDWQEAGESILPGIFSWGSLCQGTGRALKVRSRGRSPLHRQHTPPPWRALLTCAAECWLALGADTGGRAMPSAWQGPCVSFPHLPRSSPRRIIFLISKVTHAHYNKSGSACTVFLI